MAMLHNQRVEDAGAMGAIGWDLHIGSQEQAVMCC